jgi:hypothetical protein
MLRPIFSLEADKEFYRSPDPLYHIKTHLELAERENNDFRYQLTQAEKWIIYCADQLTDEQLKETQEKLISLHALKTNNTEKKKMFLDERIAFGYFLQVNSIQQESIDCVADIASLCLECCSDDIPYTSKNDENRIGTWRHYAALINSLRTA